MSHFSSLSPVCVFRGWALYRMCFPVYFPFTLFISIANTFVTDAKNIFHVCLHPCFLANRSVYETCVFHPLYLKKKKRKAQFYQLKKKMEYQAFKKVKSNIIPKHKSSLSYVSLASYKNYGIFSFRATADWKLAHGPAPSFRHL